MTSANARAPHVPWELSELYCQVQALPRQWRQTLVPLCRRLSEWSGRQRRLVQAAQDAVDDLRLDVKYLRFDLEATCRERDALRQELEQS
jgi:hypothetical protein